MLKEIEGLMTAKRNTPEGDRLDVLVTLVEAWEAKHYPLDLPDPVAAIRYHMEQNELAPKDLVPLLVRELYTKLHKDVLFKCARWPLAWLAIG